MIDFNTIILQFAEQGEKTGWTYIEIPADLAQEMKPGNKKSFRVKGKLDNLSVAGMALMPMGDGNFIMALKKDICKALHKRKGAMLKVQIEPDDDFKFTVPADLLECLEYDSEATDYFNSIAESHRGYFIKWIDSAKTDATRANRIAASINAMARRMDYGMMMREQKRMRQ
ncbi:YdeI/OmpD-associated family protein [Mucilaginibacter flavus]|uniref:YdeI/OmpD-associated family protein n=1 Tax=Mucilaginibacter flavus TaxID=931504 RepID=UPI0025B593D6|nr:YdeI/OmpD-associated family protein [Mucilaginibacter flavus]MDN3583668.1 YdeI/OmpD-associated family protein [Mucilaginibacter flavus]